MQRLAQEHDASMRENPSLDALAKVSLRLAARTEHLEIASYRRLIEKANLTCEREVGRLLTETVGEEQATTSTVPRPGEQSGRQNVMQTSQPA